MAMLLSYSSLHSYTTQSTQSTSQVVTTVTSTTTVPTDQGTSGTTTRTTSQASPTSSASSDSPINSTVIIPVAVSVSVLCVVLIILVIFCWRRNKKIQAAYRNSSAFDADGGRRNPYNIPDRGVGTYGGDGTYSASPHTDNYLYTHPYPNDTANASMEMAGMGVVTRDSRYSAMGYLDSATPGSASGAKSLSAQQQVSYANPYGYNAMDSGWATGPHGPYAGYTTGEPSSHAATVHNPSTTTAFAAAVPLPGDFSPPPEKARFQRVSKSGSAYINHPCARRGASPIGPPPCYADSPE